MIIDFFWGNNLSLVFTTHPIKVDAFELYLPDVNTVIPLDETIELNDSVFSVEWSSAEYGVRLFNDQMSWTIPIYHDPQDICGIRVQLRYASTKTQEEHQLTEYCISPYIENGMTYWRIFTPSGEQVVITQQKRVSLLTALLDIF